MVPERGEEGVPEIAQLVALTLIPAGNAGETVQLEITPPEFVGVPVVEKEASVNV